MFFPIWIIIVIVYCANVSQHKWMVLEVRTLSEFDLNLGDTHPLTQRFGYPIGIIKSHLHKN